MVAPAQAVQDEIAGQDQEPEQEQLPFACQRREQTAPLKPKDGLNGAPWDSGSGLLIQCGCDLLGDECLDYVAHLKVDVIMDADAAFHSGANLAGIVLETAERADLSGEDHHVVAQQADFGVALDKAVGDLAAGDG